MVYGKQYFNSPFDSILFNEFIPSGPQKCFHFSDINNSVTNSSNMMNFNTYMIKFPLLIVFFQNRYHILWAIEQEVRCFFFACARLSVDNKVSKKNKIKQISTLHLGFHSCINFEYRFVMFLYLRRCSSQKNRGYLSPGHSIDTINNVTGVVRAYQEHFQGRSVSRVTVRRTIETFCLHGTILNRNREILEDWLQTSRKYSVGSPTNWRTWRLFNS